MGGLDETPCASPDPLVRLAGRAMRGLGAVRGRSAPDRPGVILEPLRPPMPMSAARTRALAGLALLFGASCTTAIPVPVAGRPGDGGRTTAPVTVVNLCTAADVAADPACCSDARLVCSPGDAAAISWGPDVTVAEGVGDPPAPQGGAVVEGSYRLASETVYGTVPPDVSTAKPGDSVRSVLSVHCDIFNELYGDTGAVVSASGNDCGRLVSHEPSLLDVSGLAPDGGDAWRDQYAYSATDRTLTVITLEPYWEYGAAAVAGSYTVVDEFALVSAGSLDASTGNGMPPDAGPVPHEARDPRCPASAPAQGVACNPMPAPLVCEYGGDAYGRCTTTALCALTGDGTFQFQESKEKYCGATPAACPAAFDAMDVDASAAPDGGNCTDTQLSCNYAEGVCGCLTALSGPTWECRPRSDVGPSCPTTRPLAGDGCSAEGQECDYNEPCAPPISLGPSMLCQNGYWEIFYSGTSCPAFSL